MANAPKLEEVFSPEEEKVIRTLVRLGEKWPDSLLLFSASGTLHVMKKDDYVANLFSNDRIATIPGITNDGGDPDWKYSDA